MIKMCTFLWNHKVILSLLVFLGISGNLAALGETTNSSSPLSIRSEQMTLNNKEQRAVFKGRVVITHGDVIIRADRAEIFFNSEPGGSDGETYGSFMNPGQLDGGNDNISRILITGNVIFLQGEKRATSEKAFYNRLEETVVLTGHPVIEESDYEVTGSKVTIFLKENRSEVEESRVLIHPEAKKNKTP